MTDQAKLKILLPVDGSDNSSRAVAYAASLVARGAPMALHLLNVQPALRGDVTSFIPSNTVKEYHQEEGMKALAKARAALDAARLPYDIHIGVGQPGETVAAFARDLRCDLIIMGTRGLGSAAGLLLGSVAHDVIRHADIPITLVK